jgi:hypothetical protein
MELNRLGCYSPPVLPGFFFMASIVKTILGRGTQASSKADAVGTDGKRTTRQTESSPARTGSAVRAALRQVSQFARRMTCEDATEPRANPKPPLKLVDCAQGAQQQVAQHLVMIQDPKWKSRGDSKVQWKHTGVVKCTPEQQAALKRVAHPDAMLCIPKVMRSNDTPFHLPPPDGRTCQILGGKIDSSIEIAGDPDTNGNVRVRYRYDITDATDIHLVGGNETGQVPLLKGSRATFEFHATITPDGKVLMDKPMQSGCEVKLMRSMPPARHSAPKPNYLKQLDNAEAARQRNHPGTVNPNKPNPALMARRTPPPTVPKVKT